MLLSRVAESMLWLGRYIERAENTARLLEVTYHGKLDPSASDLAGATNTWQALITTLGATAAYEARNDGYDETDVIAFLTLDHDNAASIYSSIAAARENARSIRNLVSSETWMAINRLYHAVSNTSIHLIARDGLYEFCEAVRTGANLCAGAIRETSLHDEGLQWLWAGAALERADMVTRIVDSKYHVLMNGVEEVGGPFDRLHWVALLRSVSAWEAYMQLRPLGPDAVGVADLLLLNPQFPRSLRSAVDDLHRSLDAATAGADLRLRNEPMRLVTDLQNQLRFTTAETLIEAGLHERLSDVQRRLALIARSVQQCFFWTASGAA
jgi:uncharacterized alpha-E superfamily protein